MLRNCRKQYNGNGRHCSPKYGEPEHQQYLRSNRNGSEQIIAIDILGKNCMFARVFFSFFFSPLIAPSNSRELTHTTPWPDLKSTCSEIKSSVFFKQHNTWFIDFCSFFLLLFFCSLNLLFLVWNHFFMKKKSVFFLFCLLILLLLRLLLFFICSPSFSCMYCYPLLQCWLMSWKWFNGFRPIR